MNDGYYEGFDKMTSNYFVVRVRNGVFEYQSGSTWSKLGDPERFEPWQALIPSDDNA